MAARRASSLTSSWKRDDVRLEEKWTVEAIAKRVKVHRSTIIRALRTDGLAGTGYKGQRSGD
ncbi:hypothetical protein [Arthrobacter sp. NPDC092385]|uniref:hypothetical protein n=1 Tax=Arthrobacter sp. NPDC092385 TaxID=3363943 RepID=UPI0018C66E9C